jgi:hypothetical protein
VPPDSVPRLFARLVDDTAYSPAGESLAEAVAGHRAHRAAWYADLVGPLILPSSALAALPAVLGASGGAAGGVGEPPAVGVGEPPAVGVGEPPAVGVGERPAVGVVGDTAPAAVAQSVRSAAEHVAVAHVEVAVAKRGEDPQPGLRLFLTLLGDLPSIPGYAEIPLTWGLLAALDTLAEARAGGLPVAAKFRTGGLAAELFPTPVELAAVICACRDRQLRFKLTAGLHHAVRYTDPETGFVHHGFLNILVATVAAARGAEVAEVAEVLAATDPMPLIEPVRSLRDQPRPLWDGFGASDMAEPLTDLRQLGLVAGKSM